MSKNAVDIEKDRETITEWLNDATTSQSLAQRLELLHKAQEYLINRAPQLIPEMLNDVLNFTTDIHQEVKCFTVGFIEEACKYSEELIPKVVINLHMLLCDESVQVQKRVIKASAFIYRNMLIWLCRAPTITEEMEKGWNSLNQIKVEIVNMIDSDNDGVRTHSIKFLEGIILLQTYPESGATRKENDFSLEDVPLTLKIARRRKLEEEANHIFSLLVKFHNSPHISSVNLMACMGSLCTIAKSRPEFMSRVVSALDNLNSNLPPTLSHSQVSSVKKHLKMQLLNILKHPSCGDLRTSVTELLLGLGYSNSELNKLAPRPAEDKEKKRQAKRSSEIPTSALPLPQNKRPKLVQDLESKMEELEKIRQEAIEINKNFITNQLNLNNVIQIVLSGLTRVPNLMPNQFASEYLRSIKEMADPIKNIVKNLAEQFIEADLGPGAKLIPKEADKSRKTDSPIVQEVSESSSTGNTKALLDKLNREIKRSEASERVKQPKVKTIKLNEVTKPLSSRLQEQMLIDAVHRILKAEKFSIKIGQSQVRHKIITTLASTFSTPVRNSILNFIVSDLRTYMDLALAWLYEEYSIMQGFLRSPALLRREEKPDQSYNSLLCSLITALQNENEVIKDRDGLLARIYLEAPMVTDEALELLKQQCSKPERCISALNLLHDLIIRRPPRALIFLTALLNLTINMDQTVRDGAVQRTISIYERNDWHEMIEEYALKHLETLNSPDLPKEENEASEMWPEEFSKSRLTLYMTLLPFNEALIQELAKVYVATGAEVKRAILRLLEAPIRNMGLDSPELLLLVEKCPKGAETLVTRVIHILSDRGPPSVALVARVRELYQSRVSDVRFLIPVLTGLTKKEIISALPKLIKLNPVVVKEVFNRLLGFHGCGDSPISPSDLLIALHMIDPSKADIKAVMKATSLCFAEKQVYTQEVLAVVMQQLMDVTPLPTLLMRTVIQSLSLYPRLTGFVMNILQRLIVKQVWRQKVVWEGFIKCCQRTKPQSYHVMLQLPPPQLAEALTVCSDMKKPLQDHVSSLTDAQRAHISTSILEVLNSNDTENLFINNNPVSGAGVGSNSNSNSINGGVPPVLGMDSVGGDGVGVAGSVSVPIQPPILPPVIDSNLEPLPPGME